MVISTTIDDKLLRHQAYQYEKWRQVTTQLCCLGGGPLTGERGEIYGYQYDHWWHDSQHVMAV